MNSSNSEGHSTWEQDMGQNSNGWDLERKARGKRGSKRWTIKEGPYTAEMAHCVGGGRTNLIRYAS